MHITRRDRGLSKFQTLVCPIRRSFNPIYLSPGYFLIGEPLTQLPSFDYTNVNATDLPGGKPNNNNNNNNNNKSSGSDGLLTTFKAFNNTDAGRGHSLIYNQEISSWRGRTFPDLQPGDLILAREDITTPPH